MCIQRTVFDDLNTDMGVIVYWGDSIEKYLASKNNEEANIRKTDMESAFKQIQEGRELDC